MSKSVSDIKNPLKRGGVSQQQRRLEALDPGFVKVDERSTEDFLLFTLEFSRQLHYYDQEDQLNGDWEAFWKCSPSVLIAAIEKYNPLPLRESFFDVQSTGAPSLEGLDQLFGKTLEAARQIDDWLQGFPATSRFRRHLQMLIQANIQTLLPRLVAYEKGAAEIFELGTGYEIHDYSGFSPEWRVSSPDDIPADTSIFNPLRFLEEEPVDELPPEPTTEERLQAGYQGLTELFTQVYNILFQIVGDASGFFQESLKRDDHPPHLTLFLSFLRLYRLVQDDLNRMTQRHLDFFYKDVLQLKLKESVPDKVHLFFQLAKNVQEHALEEDIRLKAGKDEGGNDLFYQLEDDVVLNRATVGELCTVYSHYDDAESEDRQILSIHASPVANSKDGKGEAFSKTEEKPSWPTLGNSERPLTEQLGFAIAGRELLMAEGTREVTLKLTLDQSIDVLNSDLQDAIHVSLSGEKEWIEIEEFEETGIIGTEFTIGFVLSADDPPVVGLNAEALKTDYGTTLPVLRVQLRQSGTNGSGQQNSNLIYEKLRHAKIESIELTVEVSGVTNLLAFSDQGALDPSKSFMPFGPIPKVGSSFYISSVEAFQKSLDKLTLTMIWENLPISTDTDTGEIAPAVDFAKHYAGYYADPPETEEFTCKSHILKKHETVLLDADRMLFKSYPLPEDENGGITPEQGTIIGPNTGDYSPVEVQVGFEGDDLKHIVAEGQLENFGVDKESGLLRMSLKRDFEHGNFQQILTRQMLAASGQDANVAGAVTGPSGEYIIPKEPYTPTLQSLTLDYTSTATTADSEDAAGLLFLHLHPFENTYEESPEEDDSTPLLPQFEEEGRLYIGLQHLQPLQSLSLLFQVAENTADADIPPAEIQWSYLKGNDWMDFEENQITKDTTDGLITSGIVRFAVPADIDTEHTVLPAGLHWIRAAADISALAVSEAINVHAQAARAEFQDNKNDPRHLEKPLPAKKITKLEVGDPAVKKVFQEYDSFGGRPKETSMSFYTRVSERLRHKGRAVTLFDYERLVLEAFPDIYKVKCINHADDQARLRPGQVLLSVIPDFTKLKAVDRRQPKVTLSKLQEIKDYLDRRNTAFVGKAPGTLHVLNPAYEQIKVSFNVQFRPEISAREFYKKELQKAIVRFLSPWAYDEGAEIIFGGKVYKSSILNFVEEQEYVDFVTDFTMNFHGDPPIAGTAPEDISFAEGKTPYSILVPAPEDQMEICIIGEGEHCKEVTCPSKPVYKKALGYMTLDVDFEVNNKK